MRPTAAVAATATLALCLAGPIVAQVLPDLTVDGLHIVPREPTAEDPFRLDWSLRTTVWDHDDSLLCEVLIDGALFTRSVCWAFQQSSVTHPGLAAGLHSVTIEVDPDQSVQEREEDNNSRSRVFEVHPAPAIDWSVRRLRVPRRAEPGESIAISFAAAASEPATAACEVVVDAIAVSTSECVAGRRLDVEFGPMALGYHSVEAFIRSEPDPDRDNNHAGRVVRVGADPGFDLWIAGNTRTIGSDAIEASSCLGGGGRSLVETTVGVWLDRRNPPRCTDPPALEIAVSLRRNRCLSLTLGLSGPAVGAQGWIKVDPRCELAEANRANNSARFVHSPSR